MCSYTCRVQLELSPLYQEEALNHELCSQGFEDLTPSAKNLDAIHVHSMITFYHYS